MKKITWLCLLLLFLLGVPQYSFAQPARLAYLKDVNVVTSADSTKIVLMFNRPSQEKGVIYRGNFIQMEFPDTLIDPSKQWINVNDELVKNIFLYQFDDNTVRARIFTIGKARNLKDKVIFSREDNRIIIQYDLAPEAEKINIKPVETIRNINNQLSGVSNHASAISSQQVVASGLTPAVSSQNEDTTGAAALLTPAIIGHSETKTENNEQKPVINDAAMVSINKEQPVKIPIGIESPGIYSSFLRMVIVLGILISLLLIALFMVKKYFGKNIGIADKNQGIRIITSAYLGPKKSIALVDVSGERIVVGITPNHISMLTRLSKDNEFKDILKEQISSDEKVELRDELWEKV